MSMPYAPSPGARRFIDRLRALHDRGDRGAMAALRRLLGREPGEVVAALPYVQPWIPRDATLHDEARFFLVAGLFAQHPLDATGVTLGEAAHCLFVQSTGSPGVERRFAALLAADAEDLPVHLRHFLALLRTGNVPVDYAQLLDDLRSWSAPERRVQRRWARAFWQSRTDPDSPSLTPATAEVTP
jgi:CRISPR system Cascade subunit CasB